ncbi:hypothetical protein IAR50_003869 [Cryptococcus sp. DSM 104548]
MVVEHILQNVDKAKNELGKISQETQDVENQSKFLRAQSDFATINAMINEAFQPAFNTKRDRRAWFNEIQQDRTEAKSLLERSWRFPRTAAAASDTFLATIEEEVHELMINDELRSFEGTDLPGKKAEQNTATSRPWKSGFDWADDEDDDNAAFDQGFKEWLKGKARRNGRESTAVTSTTASELHAPAAASDGMTAAQYLYGRSQAKSAL